MSGLRTHDVSRNHLLDKIGLAQASESSGRKDDGVVFSFDQFAQASVDVASQGMNLEIRAQRLQLCLAPKAARADACLLGQSLDARIPGGTENVLRIFPLGNGGNFKSGGKLSRKIFQAVYSEVDSPLGERLF